MISSLLQLSFLLGLVSSTWWTTATALNLTLNATALDSLSDLSSAIGSRVYVICQSGQLDYSLYVTENQNDVDSCSTSGSYTTVGNCYNSPLLIQIRTLTVSLPDTQSYEVGTEYYFIVFQTNGNMITSNQPCLDGFKFSLSVVAVPDPVGSLSSSVVMVQSSNVAVVSSSIDAYNNPISSPSYELLSTLSTVLSSSGVSMIPSRGSASITSARVRSTSTNGAAARRSTTMTTMPGVTPVTGRIDTNEIKVTTYAGIGGGAAFLIIAVIVLVIILIVVAVVVSRRRKRNLGRNSVIYDEACESQKNSTLKRMVSLDEDDDDQKKGGYQLTERPLTFQPNGNGNIAGHGNISPAFSSNEEESLRSTTSMDPLLTSSPPNSPIRPNPSPSTLEAIPEGPGLDNSNNDYTTIGGGDHLDTKIDLGNDKYGNNVPQQSNSNVHIYEGVDNDDVLH